MPGFPHSPPSHARYRILAGTAALVGLLAYLLWPESPSEAPAPKAPQLQARPSSSQPDRPPEPAPKQRTYELAKSGGMTFDPHAEMLHCETPFLEDGLPITVRVHAPLAVRRERSLPFFSAEQVVEVTDGALSLSLHEADWPSEAKRMVKSRAAPTYFPIEYVFPDGSVQVVSPSSNSMCPENPDDAPQEIELAVIVNNFDLIPPDDRYDIDDSQGHVAGIDNCGRQVPVVDGRATIKQASGTTCPITAYRWDGWVRVHGESVDVTFDESLRGPLVLTLPNEVYGSLEFSLKYHEDSPPTLGPHNLYCDISQGALDAELLVGAQLLEVDGTSLRNLRQDRYIDYELHRELFTGPVNDTRPWTILPRGSETPITFEAAPCRQGISLDKGPEWMDDMMWLHDLDIAYREERVARELSGSR